MRVFLLTATIFLSVLFSFAAHADILGWRVGANSWQQSYEGDVQAGSFDIDIEKNLGYDDATGVNLYLSFEHPIPLIPNIMIQRTEIDTSGRGSVGGIEFGGIELDGAVTSSMDLSHTDFTLYYEILDNWVSFDIGITGRLFDDGVQITDVSTGRSGDLDISYMIPLLYAEARFDLPFSGLSLGVNGSGISYDGDSLFDLKVNLAYEFVFGLGIEGGYRTMNFEYDDGEDFADVRFGGIYAGLFWDF